jgi:hypothetical protein
LQDCASWLPPPVLSHFQIEPSLQKRVFAMQAVSRHAPSEQDCEGRHVAWMLSAVPSSLQTFTFKPSQRAAPAVHWLSGVSVGPSFLELLPLHAAADATSRKAHTPTRKRLFPMT